MREIKFRAWDKDNEIILDWEIEDKTLTDLCNDETLILMQYTGLKDKNGVDIYEGDIVKWSKMQIFKKRGGYLKNPIKRKKTSVVSWEVENAGFLISEDSENDTWLCAYTASYNITTKENENLLEVIGNIFENPELLEETK